MMSGTLGTKASTYVCVFDIFFNGCIIDAKDKFKIWRRDLGDTMINPYYVLREEMLSILLDHSVYIINQWSTLPSASQVCLYFDPEPHIPKILTRPL